MLNHSQNVYDELVKTARFYNELYGLTPKTDKDASKLPDVEKVRNHYNAQFYG